MSQALIEKILRARESIVSVNGHSYTIRRPTDADVARMTDQGRLAYIERFVVGWDLQEIDLIPGGNAMGVPFTAQLWTAHVADHPELWEPLGDAIDAVYQTHRDQHKDIGKN